MQGSHVCSMLGVGCFVASPPAVSRSMNCDACSALRQSGNSKLCDNLAPDECCCEQPCVHPVQVEAVSETAAQPRRRHPGRQHAHYPWREASDSDSEAEPLEPAQPSQGGQQQHQAQGHQARAALQQPTETAAGKEHQQLLQQAGGTARPGPGLQGGVLAAPSPEKDGDGSQIAGIFARVAADWDRAVGSLQQAAAASAAAVLEDADEPSELPQAAAVQSSTEGSPGSRWQQEPAGNGESGAPSQSPGARPAIYSPPGLPGGGQQDHRQQKHAGHAGLHLDKEVGEVQQPGSMSDSDIPDAASEASYASAASELKHLQQANLSWSADEVRCTDLQGLCLWKAQLVLF